MADKQQKPSGFLDGVVNPKGIFPFPMIPLVTIAAIPVTSYLTTPGSLVQRAIQASLQLLPGTIPASRTIPGLAAIYIFVAMPLTGGLSVAGQAMSKKSMDSNHPRQHLAQLRGLPLRLHSAHLNVLENFPIWALTAAFAQMLAPQDQQVVNLLGLAMLAKVFVYWPAYAVDLYLVRSTCHLLHTSAVVNAALRIAAGA